MSVFVPQTLNDSDDQRFSRLGRRSTMRRKVSMLVTINEDGAITTRSGGKWITVNFLVSFEKKVSSSMVINVSACRIILIISSQFIVACD